MASNLAHVSVALTVLSLFSLAHCGDIDGVDLKEEIFVEGKVYCDPCRVQFPTRISEPIEGALVGLECRSRENDTILFSADGTTDEKGIYSFPVNKDFEEQICEVATKKSPREDCNDKFAEFERARVLITKNNGVKSMARYANPLGFMKKEVSPECKEVLKELFPDDEDMPEEFKKAVSQRSFK